MRYEDGTHSEFCSLHHEQVALSLSQGSHGSGKSQEKVKILKSQEKSSNFHMGQEILKFTKVRKNGIDISMKTSFQIFTVSVMIQLPWLASARKKY